MKAGQGNTLLWLFLALPLTGNAFSKCEIAGKTEYRDECPEGTTVPFSDSGGYSSLRDPSQEELAQMELRRQKQELAETEARIAREQVAYDRAHAKTERDRRAAEEGRQMFDDALRELDRQHH